ncbi:MAG: alpha/beta hydrolase-fold protein [bacterium]
MINLIKYNIILVVSFFLMNLIINACVEPEPSVVPQVRLLTVKNFHSNILNNDRDLRIYFPASYESGKQSYPVMYLQDGQEVFAPGGWLVETKYDSLVQSGLISEVILVGINNTKDRLSEYWPPAPYGDGTGDLYLRFLTDEVIPYIESNYRIKRGPENTAIMGSSAGGIFAFYAAWVKPEIFGLAACMSPSIWAVNKSLLRTVKAYTGPYKPIRYWIDAGNAESEDPDRNGADLFVEDAYDMTTSLIAHGWNYGTDLLLDVDYTGIHNEVSWSNRVYKPLLFFFGKSSTIVTNLTARTSSPNIDVAGTVPNVMLFTKATWNNGLSAEIPYNLLEVSSPQSELWMREQTDRIKLIPGIITTPTSILFNISYKGKSVQTSLTVVDVLSPIVSVRLKVNAPVTSGNKIFMVGNNSALGNWEPTAGFPLYLSTENETVKTYTNTLVLSRNSSITFRFCAGNNWNYEELNGSGIKISDRSLTANEDCFYSATVLQWKAVP